jgi:hypothetical protein
VPATSSLHHAARIDLTRRGLGKLARLDVATSTAGRPLPVVRAGAPLDRMPFPCGARTRKVDADGRVKFTGDGRPSQLLDWCDGALEVTAEHGWLVLRQPSHLAGETPRRYAASAAFTGAGSATERITLKPAHLALARLPEDRHLLVAAVPDAGSLVLVDPSAALAAAPIAVTTAVCTVPDK